MTWTNSDVVAPTSVAKASLATGLVYAYTKRPTWWGVSAWYLTALDIRTGRHVFSVRTGTGTLMNNHYAAITLGPDGSAYIATLGGMVRVKRPGVSGRPPRGRRMHPPQADDPTVRRSPTETVPGSTTSA